MSDQVADEGVKVHGEDTYSLARLFTLRHKRYTQFMLHVAKHIVEAHMIHRELLRIAEAKDAKQIARGKDLISHTPLTFPCSSIAKQLTSITSICNLPKQVATHPCIEHAENFLKAIVVMPVANSIRGITWIEMYALYRMAGFPKPLAKPVGVAISRPTLSQQLGQFKNNVRCIASKVLDKDSAILFKPEQKHVCHFKGLAIDGVFASVSFNIHLSPDTQRLLTIQLIGLSRKCSALVLRDFLSVYKKIPLVKLELKSKSCWDARTPTCNDLEATCCSSNLKHAKIHDKAASNTAYHAMHTMLCPSCGHLNLAQDDKLQQANLEIKMKCANCRIRSPSMDWKCHCGVVWHTCLRHALKAAHNKASVNRKIVASKASKRPLLNASLEQLLDDDLRRESKSARKQPYDGIIELGYSAPKDKVLKLGMIPPTLRERFPLRY